VKRLIEFYKETGISPITEFFDSLTSKTAQKVLWVLKLVEELERVPSKYFKKLEGTEEIWEVRADIGHDAVRLLGFWSEGSLIILTNGFQKKSQKTPSNEIALAEIRRKNYLRRTKS